MSTPETNYRKPLEAAFEHALHYLAKLEQNSVAATVGVETLRERLRKPFTEDGVPGDQVIHELARDAAEGIIGSGGGRFFAWVIGGSVPAALAADWLTSAWDQNAALYACSPAAAVVEEISGAWLKDILGLPATASFALVTGCQAAHSTCLAAARHALLAKKGWSVEEKGLYGAPTIRILTSPLRHGTFERAVRFLGMGSSQVIALPADSEDRLRADELQKELSKHQTVPTIVLLQAGDINIGAFDSFRTLIPIAKRHGAWVHVDGAFGLWAAASPQYRHLVEGIAAADSWATDGHKWLNVPYDSGYAFVADPAPHRASMTHRAAYISHDEAARDEMDWNPEWSRRARGFATYAALRQLGRKGVADIVENCCKQAKSIVAGIGKLPGAEVLWIPVCNQGLVRFSHPNPQATEEEQGKHTEEVVAAILKTGEAFFGCTTWRGKRAMRVSVCNWQTSERDVERAIRSVATALQQVTSTKQSTQE